MPSIMCITKCIHVHDQCLYSVHDQFVYYCAVSVQVYSSTTGDLCQFVYFSDDCPPQLMKSCPCGWNLVLYMYMLGFIQDFTVGGGANFTEV